MYLTSKETGAGAAFPPPDLAAAARAGGGAGFFAAYVTNDCQSQYPHAPSDFSENLPVDLLLPSTSLADPSPALQKAVSTPTVPMIPPQNSTVELLQTHPRPVKVSALPLQAVQQPSPQVWATLVLSILPYELPVSPASSVPVSPPVLLLPPVPLAWPRASSPPYTSPPFCPSRPSPCPSARP